MQWRVLVSAPRAVAEISRYEAALESAGCYAIAQPTVENLTEAELLPIASDVDGVICGDDQITARALDGAPRLRVICKWGTGTDSIDVEGARSRGIGACNVLGTFFDPVADSVLGYILLFARQLDRMSADMNAGFWRRRPLVSLSECTLGIVGLGRIRTAVAHRAAAFGMRTLATTLGSDPSCDEVSVQGIEIVPLDELLVGSDFVTLHADMRPENRYLVGAAELAMMRPTAVLVNAARGALVDERALVHVLQSGRLGGGGPRRFRARAVGGGQPITADAERLPCAS